MRHDVTNAHDVTNMNGISNDVVTGNDGRIRAGFTLILRFFTQDSYVWV
jgi:hypothetical protein